MALLNVKTIVIVPRSNLVSQWKERILQYTNIKSREIGVVSGGKASWTAKKIVVGLVHSVTLDRCGIDFKRNFGCVIYDEVDRSVPPRTFAAVVSMFSAKYRLGLSATLKRKDGLSKVFEKHVGECLLKTSVQGRLKPIVIMHHFQGSSGYVHSKSSALNRRGMLLSRISQNIARNKIIARYIHLYE